ncbi:uncharacterized protein M8220_010987 isoform 2-T2 [Acridotheres tristis]
MGRVILVPLTVPLARGRYLCVVPGRGRAADAISNAVYEELDYMAMPEYQKVSSGPGSLSEGSVKKLPYSSGDSVDGSDTEAAPGGISSPPSDPGATMDPSEQSPGHTDYDDVGSSVLETPP